MRRHNRFGKLNRPNYNDEFSDKTIISEQVFNDASKKTKIKPNDNNTRSKDLKRWFLSLYNQGRKDFKNYDLRYIDLSYLYIEGVSFNGSDLSECNLTSSRLSNVSFENAYLDNAICKNLHLSNSSLNNSSLKNAILFKAQLISISFNNIVLDSANIAGVQFINPLSLTLKQLLCAFDYECAIYEAKFIDSIGKGYEVISTTANGTRKIFKGTYKECLEFCQEYARELNSTAIIRYEIDNEIELSVSLWISLTIRLLIPICI
jgi:uncharacterized protein YjbI with pentapeptide repeats